MNIRPLTFQKSTRETLTLLFLSLCACVALSDVGNAGTGETAAANAGFASLPAASITTMAEDVVKQRQSEVKKPIYVVNVFRSEKTPIAAVNSLENMCVLVINKNPAGWAAWGESLKGLDDKQRMAFVNTALIQEVETCKNSSLASKSNTLPKLELSKAVVKHLDHVSAKFASSHGSHSNGLFHSAIAMEIRHVLPL